MGDNAHIAAVDRDRADGPLRVLLVPVFVGSLESEAHLPVEVTARQLAHERPRVGIEGIEVGIHLQPALVRRAAERAVAAAEHRSADGLGTDDAATQETLLRAAALKRTQAEQAECRLNAALDAIQAAAEDGEDAADDDAMLQRLSEAVSQHLDAAGDDLAALNAVLRRWFDRFETTRADDGRCASCPCWPTSPQRV